MYDMIHIQFNLSLFCDVCPHSFILISRISIETIKAYEHIHLCYALHFAIKKPSISLLFV